MNVLELYSGIGGMHYALKESRVEGQIVSAVEINPTANNVYQHNFPKTKLLQRNIQSLSAKEINSLEVNMIMMSPPCQPFTRVGLQKDVEDERTNSFLHILKILPDLSKDLKYIVLENVKGFENSETRSRLVLTLKRCNFLWQEIIVCPSQFMIPNTRHRYYLIAKRKPLEFIFEKQDPPMVKLPFPIADSRNSGFITDLYMNLSSHYQLLNTKKGVASCKQLKTFLDATPTDEHLLPDNLLSKRAWLLDIVTPEDRRSCCFTKAYGHYVEGTGSVITESTPDEVARAFGDAEVLEAGGQERLALLKSLRLRYFTPREISKLMKFPEIGFGWPEDVTTKQKYRLLGNSINVYVVSRLILLLVAGDK